MTSERLTSALSEIHYRRVEVGGTEIFYREAGDPALPTILLLHGFPTTCFAS
jgi:pimeloyl-ACP methyl ester carboxylesterase